MNHRLSLIAFLLIMSMDATAMINNKRIMIENKSECSSNIRLWKLNPYNNEEDLKKMWKPYSFVVPSGLVANAKIKNTEVRPEYVDISAGGHTLTLKLHPYLEHENYTIAEVNDIEIVLKQNNSTHVCVSIDALMKKKCQKNKG